MANVPIKRLEAFVMGLLDIEHPRHPPRDEGADGDPQHFLQDEVREAAERMATRANERGVDIAVHTHVNAAQQVTPLVGRATRSSSTRGSATSATKGPAPRREHDTQQLLELCFMLQDHAKILPYYFYICDMIPNAEHWRTAVWEVQDLQHAIMGYLPGFATPRMVVDVPSSASAGLTRSRRTTECAGSRAGRRTTGPGSRRGSGGVLTAVPLLRPHLDPASRGSGVVAGAARARRRRADRGAPAPARLRND